MNGDTEPESLDQYRAKDGKEESPATRRNRLCALEQLRVSRKRNPVPTYVAASNGLEQILDTFRATTANEQVLERCIAPLYIFRCVFESEMVRAKTNNSFRVQHDAEQQIETTKGLIRCFIEGTWPLSDSCIVGESNSFRRIVSPPRERPTPKSYDQDKQIERALRELGIDPLNIPPFLKPGSPGLKSQVKAKVFGFTDSSFDHAWKRANRRSREAQSEG